jgi:peptidoglycan hydrolase CwlO-like protein
MIKKALIGTAVLGMLGVFVFGRDVFSYLKTAGAEMRDAVKSEVPLDFEIQRARKMVEQLVPDIRRCMHSIAEQQVDVEYLSEVIDRREDGLDKQKQAIFVLQTDYDRKEKSYVIAGRTYSAAEVHRDLQTRFGRYKVASESLERDKTILQAREKALRANQDQLDEMLVAKQDLEVQVEQLQARMKSVQAVETVSTLEIDKSQLARTKKLIRDLNKQLDVREKMLDHEGKFNGLIPVETAPAETSDLTREIDKYFDKETTSEAVDAATAKL